MGREIEPTELQELTRLIAAGFNVRLISSMALARTREALHNGWDKNDPKVRQCTIAPYLLASRPGRDPSTRQQFARLPSADMLPKMATTEICAARQPSPLPPRWRVSFTP